MSADTVWIVGTAINSEHTSLSGMLKKCFANGLTLNKNNLYDILDEPINIVEIPTLVLLDPDLPDRLIQRLNEWRSNIKWPGIGYSPIFKFMVKSSTVEEIQDKWDPHDINDYDFIQVDNLFNETILKNIVIHARKQRRIAENGVLIGESRPMRRLKELIEKFKDSQIPVLVSGESGTGKELIARNLHSQGIRASHPFIAINSSALPDNLFESEMYGYKKGSFTSADQEKTGLCAKAHRGTLFLDEIGDLAIKSQPKLLRFLQDYRVQKIGSHVQRAVDVRIVAATNKNLEKMAESGKFRNDLLYRLNVVNFLIPPLRDRKEDIPILLKHLCLKFACRSGVLKSIDPNIMDALFSYDWPGNVRELESVIDRGYILSDSDKIAFKDLPKPIQSFHGQRWPVSAENSDFSAAADYRTENVDCHNPESLINAFEKNGWNPKAFLYSIKPLLRLVAIKQFKLNAPKVKKKLRHLAETYEEDVRESLKFLRSHLNPDDRNHFNPDHLPADLQYLKSAIVFCNGNVQRTSKLLKVLGYEDNVSIGFIKIRLGLDKSNKPKSENTEAENKTKGKDDLAEWYRRKFPAKSD